MNWPDDYIGKVIHGDCIDVVQGIPDGAIDAIITDPVWPNCKPQLAGSEDPYGLLARSAADWPRLTKRVIVILGCDSDPRILTAIPSSLPFVRLCWLERVPPTYKGPILYSADIAYVFGQRHLNPGTRLLPGKYRCSDSQVTAVSQSWKLTKANDHPTPRNPLHMAWLIEKFTRPGQLILDPFCGGGTTLAAATRSGRRSIGIEIDPLYIAKAQSLQNDADSLFHIVEYGIQK